MAHVTPVAIGSDEGDDKRERDLAFWAKTILIWFIQVVGVSCAIIFGMFSTLAWQNSEIAKRQADSANILSMVALCMQLNDKDEGYHALCQTVNVAARDRLQALAVSMFGAVPEPTATSTFGPSSTWPTSTSSTVVTSSASSGGPTSISTTTGINTTLSERSTTAAPSTLFTPRTTLSTTRTRWVVVGPSTMPDPGNADGGDGLGVADKVFIAVAITTTVMTLLSAATLLPRLRKQFKDARRRGHGRQGQFSPRVGRNND
ncbi:hypothetical protein QBC37DRAFT_96379 [Rhypophila decipiens]|uniref:Uncharacterized protein n=1 Tax=Rhypophila decipiens TaxID=261697 RepID=A0AAN7AZN9_9PEZI|nr:hypothetical protein QBC37DRAFT_96379 [Rhypophila decipiens]